MNRNKSIAAITAFAAIALAGCSTTQAGEQAVMVDSMGSPTVSGCMKPENQKFTPASNAVIYPARAISWDATGDKDSESGPTRVTSNQSDPAELDVPYVITFDLTQDCNKLQDFHRKFGTKYNVGTKDDKGIDQGWNDLLRYVVGQPAQNTVVSISQKYPWQDVWNNDKVRVEFQQALTDAMPKATALRTDGVDYFTNFQVTVMKPSLVNDGLKQAIVDKQKNMADAAATQAKGVADAEARKAKADADVKASQAETIVAQQQALQQQAIIAGYPDVDAYLRATAIDKGITPWPSPIIAGAPAH